MNTGWWVAETLHSPNAGPVVLLSWVFWVLFSITLHELGHGWAAIRVGDTTPLMLNRMTLNPFVHMGPTSLILFAVIGLAWGAMPVNPSRFKGRHADAFVAAAGPAVNLGLWALCVLAAALLIRYVPAQADAPVADFAYTFFTTGAFLNAALLMLNLLPVPPLDGSRILASFCRPYRNLVEGPSAATISTIAILFVFFLLGGEIMALAGLASASTTAAFAAILPA